MSAEIIIEAFTCHYSKMLSKLRKQIEVPENEFMPSSNILDSSFLDLIRHSQCTNGISIQVKIN